MRVVLNVGIIILVALAFFLMFLTTHTGHALFLLGLAILGQALINEDKIDRILKEIE